MIMINQIDMNEYKDVEYILQDEGIIDNLHQGIIYGLKYDAVLAGIGKVVLKSDYGILNYIIIRRDYRGQNMGDALLRALLFKLENMGIEKVFFPNTNSYLVNKGFVKTPSKYKTSHELYLKISDIFNMPCGGGLDGV